MIVLAPAANCPGLRLTAGALTDSPDDCEGLRSDFLRLPAVPDSRVCIAMRVIGAAPS